MSKDQRTCTIVELIFDSVHHFIVCNIAWRLRKADWKTNIWVYGVAIVMNISLGDAPPCNPVGEKHLFVLLLTKECG